MPRNWTEDPFIPSVYVVAWPDRVWQVGYSGTRERWGRFIASGARLVDLVEFWTEGQARTYERHLRDGFLTFSERAFSHPDQAWRHMRDTHRTGWTECVRVSEDRWQWCLDVCERDQRENQREGARWADHGHPVAEMARMVVLSAAWCAVDGAGHNGQFPDGHVPWEKRARYVRAERPPVAKPEMWAVA